MRRVILYSVRRVIRPPSHTTNVSREAYPWFVCKTEYCHSKRYERTLHIVERRAYGLSAFPTAEGRERLKICGALEKGPGDGRHTDVENRNDAANIVPIGDN